MEAEIDLDSEKENIRKLLKAGNSFKNIAENYNISTTKLWTFVRKNNLKENFKPFKERNRWTEDEIRIVRDYLNDDKSIEEITKALNEKHSEDSVKTLITKQGKKYNLNYKSTRHYPTKEEIEEVKQLVKNGLPGAIITVKEACEKYNISETSAKRWSLEEKHGLISIYNPRINKTK